MPEFVLDESTVAKIVEQFTGLPIQAAPGGGLFDPGVQDVLDGDDSESVQPWQPADRRTQYLILGTEACREVHFCAQRFGDRQLHKRALKNLAVAVCNLMDTTLELQKSLGDEESRKSRLRWPTADQNAFVAAGRRIKKVHKQGPVRRLRHKLGAHLDPDVFETDTVRIEPKAILEALADSLLVLSLSFNHDAKAFSWIRLARKSRDETQYLVDTMFDYPLCSRWITDDDGKVLALAQIIPAADPRHKLGDDVLKTIDVYNYLIKATDVTLPEMFTRATSDLLRGEGREPFDESLPKEFLIGRVTQPTR